MFDPPGHEPKLHRPGPVAGPVRPVGSRVRPRWRRADVILPFVATLLAVGCGGSGTPAPPVAPDEAAREMERTAEANRLERPTQLFFRWSAQEPDFRGSGEGVARLLPPDRARLDLFLDNGEQVAQAVLLGDELEIPSWVEVGMIPPPPLLWASLGVFRPGPTARLEEVRGLSEVEADYRLPDGDVIRFRVEGRRLQGASVFRAGDRIRTLDVAEPERGSRFPASAAYRDVPDFRELKVDLSSVEYVDGFPSDIWAVSGR